MKRTSRAPLRTRSPTSLLAILPPTYFSTSKRTKKTSPHWCESGASLALGRSRSQIGLSERNRTVLPPLLPLAPKRALVAGASESRMGLKATQLGRTANPLRMRVFGLFRAFAARSGLYQEPYSPAGSAFTGGP
jgi:hypothetical protein